MVYGLFLVSGLAVARFYALAGVAWSSCEIQPRPQLRLWSDCSSKRDLSWQVAEWGMDGPLSWLSAVVVGIGLSVAYGLLVAPSLAWREPAVKAIATLGYMLLLLGLIGFIWEDALRKISLPTDKIGLSILGVRVTVTRIVAFTVTLLVVIGMVEYLRRTRVAQHAGTGRQSRPRRASGHSNPEDGNPGLGYIRRAGGFTGLIFGSLVRLEPTVITFMVIPAIAAAICGRLSSLWLTLAGGLFIGVAESMLTLYKPLAPLRTMAPFIVAALVILWMQRGQTLTFARES